MAKGLKGKKADKTEIAIGSIPVDKTLRGRKMVPEAYTSY